MKRLFNRPIPDIKITLLAILLIGGIGYYLYSTVRHFQAVNQLDEAKTIMRDIQNLLGWSILQPQADAIQVCNLQNIQQISKQEEFQKIKQLLGWNVNIQQHSKYVESINVYAAPDLHGCIIRAHFRKDAFVSDELAGKYITYQYDFKKSTTTCVTNIKKYALVKSCTRL
ncbi:hypothetical protein ACG93R_07040 [Acinetobacter guillouiae]|uniref:hypothetical protein n=1 Tax=Acinetobacter guillouiae TaxID=106649 RepID=UPI003AF9889B